MGLESSEEVEVLSCSVVADSLASSDSLAAEVLDSTRIGFLEAIGKVKIFKKNMNNTLLKL